MRHPSRIESIVGSVALAAAVIAPSAHAALGGNLDSVLRDRALIGVARPTVQARSQTPATMSPALPGAISTSPPTSYTMHEISTPSGTLVHEFTDTSGRVFAVAWSGPMVPDLRQLLGENFETYAGAGRTGPRAHGRRAVTRGDLVVQSSGRMRAFTGKAYLTSLIPTGVSIDALR